MPTVTVWMHISCDKYFVVKGPAEKVIYWFALFSQKLKSEYCQQKLDVVSFTKNRKIGVKKVVVQILHYWMLLIKYKVVEIKEGYIFIKLWSRTI